MLNLLVLVILLSLVCLAGDDSLACSFCAIICVLLGILNIFTCLRRTRLILHPLSVFSFVWLIMIPIASFNYPLMAAMETQQWTYVLAFSCIYMVAGSLFPDAADLNSNTSSTQERYLNLSSTGVRFSCFLVALSVLAVLVDAYFHGGFIALSSEVYLERFRMSFPGYYLVRDIGNLGIVLLSLDPSVRRKPTYIVCLILMVLVNLSIGVRFSLFVLAIGVISSFSSLKFKSKALGALLVAIVLGICAFGFVSSLRDDAEQMQVYMIDTGFYRGQVSDLTSTEVFRYVGYAARLTSDYVEDGYGGITHGIYTGSPITDLLQIEVTTPSLIQHYGYNATTIITYLYMDFGPFWPLAAFAWSLLVNYAFQRNMKRHSLFSGYWCAVAYISLVLSFYTYIHAYSYWIAYYPFLLILVQAILGKMSHTIHGLGDCNEGVCYHSCQNP